jgi:hypothetical protein
MVLTKWKQSVDLSPRNALAIIVLVLTRSDPLAINMYSVFDGDGWFVLPCDTPRIEASQADSPVGGGVLYMLGKRSNLCGPAADSG